MPSLTIRYKTLTPLYTGNAQGKANRLRETGLIGSLRWWFEALVRGAGGLAFDPTTASRSAYDSDDYEKAKKEGVVDERLRLRQTGLDDAAQIFGATGWRRRFRLVVTDAHLQSDKIRFPPNGNQPAPIKISSRLYTSSRTGQEATPTWYLKDFPLNGDFALSIQPLQPGFDPAMIGGLLAFIEKWGGLGAKNQHGLGVIARSEGNVFNGQTLYEWLCAIPPITSAQQASMARLPSLSNMFFAELQASDSKTETTYELKYDLRRLFAADKRVRHFVMGTVRGDRVAAKIKMTLPYGSGNRMRVWGWLPPQANAYNSYWDRDKIFDAVKVHLQGIDPNMTWREFNSPRDTINQESDICHFLAGMLL